MGNEAKESAEKTVEMWRSGAALDSPAGPLFAGGQYAEADIVVATWPISGRCGTACSGSYTRYCC